MKKLFKKLDFITPYLNKRANKKMIRLAKYIGKAFPYSPSQLKKLKKIALSLHKYRGSQFHIIPVGELNVAIINNTWLDAYNKSVKHKSKKINYITMMQKAYFSTNSQRLIEDNRPFLNRFFAR